MRLCPIFQLLVQLGLNSTGRLPRPLKCWTSRLSNSKKLLQYRIIAIWIDLFNWI